MPDYGLADLGPAVENVEYAVRQSGLRQICANRMTANGLSSGDLRMTQLPAARAGATFIVETCSGPFHGTIAPMTPYGSFRA